MFIYDLRIETALSPEVYSSLYTTKLRAFQKLAEWVVDMWDEEAMDADIEGFGSNADLVEHFFGLLQDDYSYEIKELIVFGPEVAEEPVELQPDEIVLNNQELVACRIAIYAYTASPNAVKAIKAVEKIDEALKSAYEKLAPVA